LWSFSKRKQNWSPAVVELATHVSTCAAKIQMYLHVLPFQRALSLAKASSGRHICKIRVCLGSVYPIARISFSKWPFKTKSLDGNSNCTGPPVCLSPVSHDKTACGYINRLCSHCPYVFTHWRIPACPSDH